MSHVVLAAPSIDRFHLLERFGRELTSRGHRVTVLCLDPVGFSFWSTQGLPTTLIPAGPPTATRAPLREFAEIDCRLRNKQPVGHALARSRQRLAALLPGLLRFFEGHPPDLVFFHQERGGAHRLIHFLATECGARTLWTGNGLLPHTMQVDGEGIDGDARMCRRSARDFRDLDLDEPLLQAALSTLIGRNTPPALSRRMLLAPPLSTRIRDALRGLAGHHDYGVLGALDAWQRAAPQPEPVPGTATNLPARPFVAVLLQREDDDRLRLDATAPPRACLLTRAVRTAVRRIDTQMPIVGVLPDRALLPRELATLRRLDGLILETAGGAMDACLTAAAVVTINAPTAAVALLANTPVLHLGTTPYGLPGIALRTQLDSLSQSLAAALNADARSQQQQLQRRFLTWMLSHGHVWCSPGQPDHNGLNGLILETERRLAERGPFATSLQYRTGPAWPLTVERGS